jgi:hypothetical protein
MAPLLASLATSMERVHDSLSALMSVQYELPPLKLVATSDDGILLDGLAHASRSDARRMAGASARREPQAVLAARRRVAARLYAVRAPLATPAAVAAMADPTRRHCVARPASAAAVSTTTRQRAATEVQASMQACASVGELASCDACAAVAAVAAGSGPHAARGLARVSSAPVTRSTRRETSSSMNPGVPAAARRTVGLAGRDWAELARGYVGMPPGAQIA